MDNSQIRDQVRERYAGIARQALKGKSDCCGGTRNSASSCCSSSDVIPADLISTNPVPADVANTSLGCGTPLEIASPQPGETVLDLGSGGGLDCFLAAKQVGETGRVIGVDMTPDMLALASANAQKVGAGNVEFRHGYLEALPVEDASVDVIISNCVINLSPDKDRVFAEAYRALKPGGRIAISDIVTRVPLPKALRQDMTAWASCVSGAIKEADYLAKMRAAGFADAHKVAGGENRLEPVYSAKFLARKAK